MAWNLFARNPASQLTEQLRNDPSMGGGDGDDIEVLSVESSQSRRRDGARGKDLHRDAVAGDRIGDLSHGAAYRLGLAKFRENPESAPARAT